jgi:hypothetical protein
MKLAAMIKSSQQYSMDDWESISYVLQVDENTTIKEIMDWQKKKFPNYKKLQTGESTHQIHIMQMD